MKHVEICRSCGEEVIFDIEGVNIFGPADLKSVDERFQEIRGYHDPEEVKMICEEFFKDRLNRKMVRFFSECKKCGAKHILHIYVPVV